MEAKPPLPAKAATLKFTITRSKEGHQEVDGTALGPPPGTPPGKAWKKSYRSQDPGNLLNWIANYYKCDVVSVVVTMKPTPPAERGST